MFLNNEREKIMPQKWQDTCQLIKNVQYTGIERSTSVAQLTDFSFNEISKSVTICEIPLDRLFHPLPGEI